MHRTLYRYQFDDLVPMRDVEETLHLAMLATESLHGAAQARLDASFRLREDRHSCVIDADTEVGSSLARIFTGFLGRGYGLGAFRVERVVREAGR